MSDRDKRGSYVSRRDFYRDELILLQFFFEKTRENCQEHFSKFLKLDDIKKDFLNVRGKNY